MGRPGEELASTVRQTMRTRLAITPFDNSLEKLNQPYCPTASFCVCLHVGSRPTHGPGQWPQAAVGSRLCVPSDLTTRRSGAGRDAVAIACVSIVVCDVGCGSVSVLRRLSSSNAAKAWGKTVEGSAKHGDIVWVREVAGRGASVARSPA